MKNIKLPILTSKQIIRVLLNLDFLCTRHTAVSHFRYAHSDGRRTTIPVHKGKDISKGLLRKILRDIDLSLEEFIRLLK